MSNQWEINSTVGRVVWATGPFPSYEDALTRLSHLMLVGIRSTTKTGNLTVIPPHRVSKHVVRKIKSPSH